MEAKKLLFCIVIYCTCSIWSFAIANGAEEAHVTLTETFGVATEKEGSFYRTITFIPRTYLLFDIDYEEPDLRVGSEYLAATTQDGVRVYLLEQVVSNGPYNTVFGSQDVIFNNSHAVCFNLSCDRSDDDQLLKISAGEVFESEEIGSDSGRVYRLIGNRGDRRNVNEIVGYISGEELDDLNRRAVVTYASLEHPRYKVISREAKLLNTSCGEVISPGYEIGHRGMSSAEEEIIQSLELGEVGIDRYIRFEKSYGGAGLEVEYQLLSVLDRRAQTDVEKDYIVQITYICDEDSIVYERIAIDSVFIFDTTTNDVATLNNEGTPGDMIELVGAPYLYSVNNASQYFSLMDKLAAKFESRALAGYFLAEYNRTCHGKKRSSDICQHDGYN